MKYGIVSVAWLAVAGLTVAAPPQARLDPVNPLLEWQEPGGCSGGWSEECMGTAAFCATRDEAPCLKKRKAPPRAQAPGESSAAEVPLRARNVRERGLR
ncbi:uncharacterized protein HRG_09023 [Hirsutella rhossiliensis]|uniref:Uncharacterized protein n=1 Tax=Hirsutella rhossiliensis TaxID=111463 RepID=A0A9P8MRC3_9HYPO|nr:uncharacterized protein HRG_09023 [Hirsutella rhossiliensis]KAH0960002.1 hypothetical protein HRG_09023 [Hirsutella rhossiliensis]